MTRNAKCLLGISLIIISVLLPACDGRQGSDQTSSAESGAAASSGSWINTDIDGAVTEDVTARVQDDFNYAKNKEYISGLKIPEGKNEIGGAYSVDEIVEKNRIAVMKDTDTSTHDGQLVNEYYQMLADWETRNSLGVQPAMKYVDEIQSISSLGEMTEYMSNKARGGLFAFYLPHTDAGGKTGSLFAYGITTSSDDSTLRCIELSPLDLSLGDAAEYRELTENGKLKKERNTAVRTVLLKELGFDDKKAGQMIENTFRLETLLSENMYTSGEIRDPANLKKMWNPTNPDELAGYSGSFPVKEILSGWGLSDVSVINVTEPEYMKSLENIYTEENLELIKDYMTVRMAESWTHILNQKLRDEATAAENKVLGVEGTVSDDQDALECVKDTLPIPLDNQYLRKHATAKTRQEITDLIHEVIGAYRTMLSQEDWLTEETRNKAIEKLDAMTIRAVYPDELESWDDLTFKNSGEDGNLLDAKLEINQYYRDRRVALLDEKIDKSVWDRGDILLSEVNAYYRPSDNSINILSGILNGVVYQSDSSYEKKLGTIGMIIGHEISHAFDPGGAQYDKNGMLKNWWTEEDSKAYDERAKKLIAYYDSLEPMEGMKYSGKLVQTEAIADMGGMKASLQVASEKADFDYREYFDAYAGLWAVKRLESKEISRIKTDVHPLAYLRTNVTVMQFDEFARQYDVKEGDGMYLAPEDRIAVW